MMAIRLSLSLVVVGCHMPVSPPPPTPLALHVSLDGGEFATAAFDATTNTFSFSAGLWLQQIQLAIDVPDPSATITIAGTLVAPSTPSPPIALALGLTTIDIAIDDADYQLDVTRAPLVAQRARLVASNAEPHDNFGVALALDGDTLAVGADSEAGAATGIDGDQTDNSAFQAGAVYIFHRDGDTWVQEAYLKPSNTRTYDTFGAALAISGNTLAVGAFQEPSAATGVNGDQTDASAAGAGAVYVYVRADDGTWSQQAFIKASNTESGDNFGEVVALWGDTLAVAAVHEDSAATGIDGNQADNSMGNAGAVYVFVRVDDGTWSQQAYVKASNTNDSDFFGQSIAVWGDTLVVGAPFEASAATGIDGNQADNSLPSSGAVYVFRRTGTSWAQEAYIKASNPGTPDGFGFAVALWHDTLAVGAPYESSNARMVNGDQTNDLASQSGAVYVFVRDAGGWTQQAYIKPFNTDAFDDFGQALSLFADRLAIGAYGEDGSATGVNPADGSVDDNDTMDSGAIYTFVRSGGAWMPVEYVKLSTPCVGCELGVGFRLALWGDTLAGGVTIEDTGAGAAYVFQ